jgi:hypothetical protein
MEQELECSVFIPDEFEENVPSGNVKVLPRFSLQKHTKNARQCLAAPILRLHQYSANIIA